MYKLFLPAYNVMKSTNSGHISLVEVMMFGTTLLCANRENDACVYHLVTNIVFTYIYETTSTVILVLYIICSNLLVHKRFSPLGPSGASLKFLLPA